mmetsp:Transcript_24884/g.71819  ORF Transcript_24884/g.71819 Transcript_24884/m.71819 type:complete len:98 (-) Transcript_24884:246-539(-)
MRGGLRIAWDWATLLTQRPPHRTTHVGTQGYGWMLILTVDSFIFYDDDQCVTSPVVLVGQMCEGLLARPAVCVFFIHSKALMPERDTERERDVSHTA